MLCIRCGHDNPTGSNFCAKCNAKLLQMAPSGVPGSSSVLEVDESTNYLTPDRRYVTEHVFNLTCRAYEYLHQGADGEPMLEAFDVIKAKLVEFEQQSMPEMLAQLQNERQDDPDSEYPKQVLYLVNKGLSLYKEGVAMFEGFAETGEDNDLLIESVTRIQDGNDNVCLAYELIGTRTQLIAEELRRREVAERTGAAAATGGAEATGNGGEASGQEEAAPAEPVDTAE